MRNPTKKQVQKVIDTLTKALLAAKKLEKTGKPSIMMLQPNIDHTCGAPMCHGGWYAAIRTNEDIFLSYYDGISIMEKDLGFTKDVGLEEWAGANPTIWGNTFGDVMFSSKFAFMSDKKRHSIYDTPKEREFQINLSTIINHWKRVQKRLPK